MAVNVKMGVDTSGFKANIQDATAQLKTFDAQLKNAEATMKATGNAEQGLTQKMNALTGKLETQKRMAQQYAQQLEKMRTAGVDPLSKEYQKLAAALLNADTGIKETQAQLDSLTSSENKAADGADKLTQSVNSISRKVSLDQVITGISAITSGLENAAKKAISFGEKLFDVIVDAAAEADDISTMATRLGLTEEEIQQINYNAARFEVTAEQLGKTWKKVKNNMASDSQEIVEAFQEIGVETHDVLPGKYGDVVQNARDYKDVFWDIGDALLHMTDAAQQEAIAQKLLGRSWDELLPLFTAGREEYEAALAAAPTASQEAIDNLAAFNDRLNELEQSWNVLKIQVLGEIAPALEKGADAIATLLDKLTAYLQTDKGQELLTKLGDAVSALFEDLANIDPDKVVENFSTLFTGVVSSFEWLKNNWESVKNALLGIAIGFGALKIATLAMNIGKVVSGLGGLLNGGNGSNGGTETGTPVPITNQDQTGNNGGLFQNLLNNLTLFAAAKTVADAVDPNKTEAGKKVQLLDRALKNNQITQEEATKEILMHDLGAEGYMEFINSKNGTSQSSAKIVSEVGEKLSFAEEVVTKVSGAVQRVTEVLGQASKNLHVAGEWTFGDELTAEEAMALVSGKKGHSGNVYFGDVSGFEMGEDVDISTFLDAEDGTEEIQDQVGTVTIPVKLSVSGIGGGFFGGSGGTNGKLWESFLGMFNITGHANGLPWVMNDGLYMLHRGERVLTASENRSYTYNNNNYFGNVNLNNGQDIDNLCDRIDRRNRRKQNGFGE